VAQNGKGWALFTLEGYDESHEFRIYGEEYLKFRHFLIQNNFTFIKVMVREGWTNKETGKKGFPEYIIRFKDNPKLILVIEDKDDQIKHESKKLNNPVSYAVDGAIHYGKALSKEFDVISIGVSGLSHNMRVTHHFHIKGNEDFDRLEFNKLLTPQEYLTFYKTDETKNKQDFENLLTFSDKLNKELFQLYKISENERAILIAAVLVALKNEKFKSSYELSTDPSELCESITSSVKIELIKSKLKQEYVNLVIGHFSFICQSPKFQSDVKFLKELILKIDKNLNGYIKNSQYQDVLGNLYIKFLERANVWILLDIFTSLCIKISDNLYCVLIKISD
jgi:hypothetical protein